MTACSLETKSCRPCSGETAPLPEAECAALLGQLPDWSRAGKGIGKRFLFPDHHAAMAFVNALAWISHREDHHPELTIGFRDVHVRYWTHAIDGLSENDFICAAKVDRLFGP